MIFLNLGLTLGLSSTLTEQACVKDVIGLLVVHCTSCVEQYKILKALRSKICLTLYKAEINCKKNRLLYVEWLRKKHGVNNFDLKKSWKSSKNYRRPMYLKVHQNGILPWNVTHFENVSFKKTQQHLNFMYTTINIIRPNGHDPNILKHVKPSQSDHSFSHSLNMTASGLSSKKV